MFAFSTVDGFVDVNQGLEEMIKYLANEPSVGLFFVQQHAQSAMPNVVNLNVNTDKIAEKTHEMILHTEDLEDSICAVRSMTECGLPIIDEMVKDIHKSLHFMSKSQPHKGLLQSSSWGFQTGRSTTQVSTSFSDFEVHAHQEGGNSRGYLSTVFNSVKQKAANLRWSQIDSMPESRAPGLSSAPLLAAQVGSASTDLDAEVDELPLSSQIVDLQMDEGAINTVNTPTPHWLSTSDNFEKFKSEQEAKLQEWLEEAHEHSGSTETIQ